MPTYRIKDPTSGRTVRLTGDSPPTEQELEEVFKSVGQQQPAAPATIAEMRRREEQGMVSALPPEQVQAAIGSTDQLNQAVKDAGKVGIMERFVGSFAGMADPSGQVTPFME